MTQRAGSADLPLHGGHVPKWLADRMTRLGAVMSQAIVHQYGVAPQSKVALILTCSPSRA